MKEPKDLTAEDFLEPWSYRDRHKDDCYTEDVTKGVIDFAQYHVKQAIIAIQELQNKKEVQGYPGTLTKEELENVYPLDKIK